MSRLFLTVFSFSILPVFVSGQTAIEIATKHERAKIAEVEGYLEATPDAADLDQALSILIGAHLSIGEFEPVPSLLERRYDTQEKGEEANIGLMLNEIVRPFVETSIVSGQRDRAKAFLARFKADFAQHSQSEQINRALDQVGSDLYLPGVGDTMELAFTSLSGEEIDLAAMKDKVVLVDFWATWCGPCIAELPHLLDTYEKYHEKGFEIIGISLDDNQQTLETFIEERGMTWPQYFDGLGWGNELAQRFGIRGIPATFLVGKDGKIVASNLRGEELERQVAAGLGVTE